VALPVKRRRDLSLAPREVPDVSKICSVYRADEGIYDYYLVKKPPKPSQALQSNPVGIPLEDALPVLQRPAKRVGRGQLPIGTIATDSRFSIAWSDIVIASAVAGVVSAVVSHILSGD
jgi:hypothetical protein